MLLIAFGKKEINYSICTLLIITYWIAGIIASILQVKGQIIMIAIACFSYILYFLYSKIEEKQKYYEIAVGFLGEEIPLKAKLDTGNELKDGLFGEPVIVISEEKAKDELSSELIRIMKNERLEIPHQYQNRIKLISFKTISGEDIKIGIKLDYVIISKEDKKIENKAIMILTEQKLNGYDTLIGSNLLEGAYVS